MNIVKMQLIALGIGFVFWYGLEYREKTLQGYVARVSVPVTANYDLQALYAGAPFVRFRIEFPPTEVAAEFGVRLETTRQADPEEVKAQLLKYLRDFYSDRATELEIRRNALQLAVDKQKQFGNGKKEDLAYLDKSFPEQRSDYRRELQFDLMRSEMKLAEAVRTLGAAHAEPVVDVTGFKKISSGSRALQHGLQAFFVGLAVLALGMACGIKKYRKLPANE